MLLFVLLIVPCTWLSYNSIIISLPLFFVSVLMLPVHSFVQRTSSFPPFWSFSFSSPFSFLLLRWKWQGSPLIRWWRLWSDFHGRSVFFCCPFVGLSCKNFCPLIGGWLVLQYLLPINWLVRLFCKDLLPISWLVLQGFLFCSILVSVSLPPEWALFTCPTFGHHSDLTIQYNQQAEYFHLDTSDLTTISTSHSLKLTSRSLLTTLSANHKFKKWKRSWRGDKRHLRSYNHLRLTLSPSLLCAI